MEFILGEGELSRQKILILPMILGLIKDRFLKYFCALFGAIRAHHQIQAP